jgi:hypothetical protein
MSYTQTGNIFHQYTIGARTAAAAAILDHALRCKKNATIVLIKNISLQFGFATKNTNRTGLLNSHTTTG